MKQHSSYERNKCAMTSGFDVTLVDVNRNQGSKEIQSNYSKETFSPGSNEKRLLFIFFLRLCRDVHLSLLILYWHGSESTIISKVMVMFGGSTEVVCDMLPHRYMLLNLTHWSF